jgi:hypothetical protein
MHSMVPGGEDMSITGSIIRVIVLRSLPRSMVPGGYDLSNI